MVLLEKHDRRSTVGRSVELLVLSVVFHALAVGPGPVYSQASGIAPPGTLSQRVVVDEIDSTVRTQVDRVDALLGESQWDEAIETYRRLVQEHGDQLVRRPDEDGFVRHVPLRQFIDWQLSQLPPRQQPALVEYRRRIDPSVRPHWEQARRDRDVDQLRRILETSLLSSYGDDALVALGDLALEAGRHTEARWCYERLHPALRWWPDDGGVPLPLGWVYRGADWIAEGPEIVERVLKQGFHGDGVAMPDADWPLADLIARLVLVSILEGDIERAETELELLRRVAPGAEGVLAGRQVVWADQLTELAAGNSARLEGTAATESSAPSGWRTVSHDAKRTGIATAWRNPVAWREDAWQLIWTVPLAAAPRGASEESSSRDTGTGDPLRSDNVSSDDTSSDDGSSDDSAWTTVDSLTERVRAFPEIRSQERYDYLLPTYPVVVEGTVYVADRYSIRAYDLREGRPLAGAGVGGEIFPATSFQLPAGETPTGGRTGVPRHTMTATDQLLVARLGNAITTQRVIGRSHERAHDGAHEGAGYLICLDRETQRLVTDILSPPSPKYAFDGTPVTDGRCLYVALRRSGVTTQAQVICYDLQTGATRWQRLVATAQSIGQGSVMEITHNLLTLDQGTGVIYFSTGLGAIAALDMPTGRIRWVTTYRRTGVERANQHQPAWHVQRDLTACLLHRGRLMVAPPDAQQIFCLDALTGRKVWKTQLADGTNDMVQLVAVVGNKLIAAGRRLWWFDANTGQLAGDVRVNPFPHSWRDGLAGCGRAVIVGGQVYWPVRGDEDSIVVFDAVSGRPWRTPISLSRLGIGPGNLVAAGEHLLVATPGALHALAPVP